MAYGTNAPFGLRPLQSITGGSWTEKTNVYTIYSNPTTGDSLAGSIFTGDPVIFDPAWADYQNPIPAGEGLIAPYAPTYTAASPATYSAVPLLGVFMGCEYFDSQNRLNKSPYWPGGTLVYPGSLIKAWVIDDPNVVYDVQVSTNSPLSASACLPTVNQQTTQKLAGFFGANFALDITGQKFTDVTTYPQNPGKGNTLTGQSGFYLCASTVQVGTTLGADYDHTLATLPLKAMGYTPNPQNQPALKATWATTPFLNVRVIINNHVYGHSTPGTTVA